VVVESAGRIVPVGCWPQARRNFFDARRNQPREVQWIQAHPEHFLKYRRDEAEATAQARRRRRTRRRAKARETGVRL
jgi:hypothetical protein